MGTNSCRKDDSTSEIVIYNTALTAQELCERLGLEVENNKILCPIHDEDDPSVQIYEDHYYCFGCGTYISPIRFVMEVNECGFKEAIRWIAKEAGLPEPSLDGDSEGHYKATSSISEIYNQVFKDSLEHPEKAVTYLKGRGLDPKLLDGKVGYLSHFYKLKDKDAAVRAGLISRNGNFLLAGRVIIWLFAVSCG